MNSRKETNAKIYAVKKLHETYDKRHKHAKIQRKSLVDTFSEMSAKGLLNYLDTQYNKLNEDEKHLAEINQAIYGRICGIINKFNRGIHIEKAEYIWKVDGQKDTPDKYYDQISTFIRPRYPSFIHVRIINENGLRFIILTPNSDSKIKSRKFLDTPFYNAKLGWSIVHRLKVDGRDVLEDFIEFKKRARKVIE
jgi:hypothetical protein